MILQNNLVKIHHLQKQEKRIKSYQERFLKVNKDSILFNKNWKENDTIKYNALAATLTRIQKNGRDEFYKGETGKKLAKFIQIYRSNIQNSRRRLAGHHFYRTPPFSYMEVSD